MREMLSIHKDMLLQLQRLEKKVTVHDKDIKLIFENLKWILNKPEERMIIKGFRRDKKD